MSLGGSLEDLSLLDILQIVNVSRRTGVLRLTIPKSGVSYVYFHQGNLADIVGDFEERNFLGYFESTGLVEAGEIAEARRRAAGDPSRVLQRLLDTGALNPQLVEQARRLELARRLKFLTQQTRGEFAFFLTESEDPVGGEAPPPFCPLARALSPQVLLTQTLADSALADVAVPPRPPSPPPAPVSVPEVLPPTPPRPKPPAPAPAPPVLEDTKEPPRSPSDQAPAPPRTLRVSPPRNRLTVLLCADESTFRHLLKKRLIEHFEDVATAASFEDYSAACRRLLAEKRPFVSLVDLLMSTRSGEGYLGGLEVLQESVQSFPQVKVLLMTDLSDDALLGMARRHGASAILEKPGLARLRVDEFEKSIESFAKTFCDEVDRLVPPVEEEVVTFLHDLGAESPAPGDRIRDQLSLLKGLMGELASPKESSEISLLVLRLAAEYFDRAILFLVRREAYIGLGGFGETGDPELMMAKVRRLKIPSGAGSFLDGAVTDRLTVLKTREDLSTLDRDFTAAIGAIEPSRLAAIPMVSRGRVIALLYGDNGRGGEELPDLTGMEIFMAQAGLAMEKALLEMQIMNLKRSIPREIGD
ncbi:MAG: response regulator [Acidobacteriota bacterium]